MGLYDYRCNACNETWEEYHRMDDRKIPESLPCPKCSISGQVEQIITNTCMPVSASLEASRKMNSLKNSKFQEKLSQIHANNPGSVLDKVSTITPISK